MNLIALKLNKFIDKGETVLNMDGSTMTTFKTEKKVIELNQYDLDMGRHDTIFITKDELLEILEKM